MTTLDIDYLRMAYHAAWNLSSDPDTQNGAILFDPDRPFSNVVGANRLPPHVKGNPSRLQRPHKYSFIEHAERDLIFRAWQDGHDTEGCTMYCPWYCCAECARVVSYAGIKRIVGHKAMFDKTPERWQESINFGNQILDDSGVERVILDIEIGHCQNRFDGKVWFP